MSLFLIDTTVLIAHLRGDPGIKDLLVRLIDEENDLGTTGVNVAEIESGLREREAVAAKDLLDRLDYLHIDREASRTAGRYQRHLREAGRTLHTADALIAGTAHRHGAILMTDNRRDFPMGDIEVIGP